MSSEALQPLAWFLGAEIAALGTFFYLLPGLTRHDIFFAVTVAPEFRKNQRAQSILRRFHRVVVLQSLVAVVLAVAAIYLGSILLLIGSAYWQVAWAFLAFYRGRKHVLPHAVLPAPVREALLAPRAPGLLGHPLLQAGPFAIIAGVAVYLRLRWNDLPQHFPVHWGVDGKPNGWASRNFLGVYAPLLVALTISAGLAMLAYGTLHWSRQIHASGVQGWREWKFKQTQIGILIFTEYFIALLFGWLSVLPLRADAGMPTWISSAILLAALVYIVAILVVLVRTGQAARTGAAAADVCQSCCAALPIARFETFDMPWR